MSGRDLRAYVGDLDLTDYPYSLAYNELDLPAGENVMTFFEALLVDGSIGTSSRTNNRTLTVPIYVEGSDLLDLAANEEALILACERERNTFTLDPGDGIAPASVFDTFRIQATHERDDDQESALMRRWNLSIPALPWVRSPEPITVTFSPATPTITTLDAATALTNFSVVSGGATLSTVTYLTETAVKVAQPDSNVAQVRWSGAFTGTAYVALDVYSGAGTPAFNLYSFGGNYPLATQAQANGYTRLFYLPPTSPATILLYNSTGGAVDFHIGGIYGATSLPSTGVLSSVVEGSVRTNGVLTVSGGTLGHTMVYADPTMTEYGWQPDVATTWANCPEGTYAVYVKHTGALTYSVGTLVDFTVGDQVAYTRTEYAYTDDEWFPVGRITLGGRRDGRAGSFTPTMHTTGSVTNRYSSFGVRLFRMAPDTSLTYVRDVASTRLLIDLPSLDYPRGGVWGGAAGSEVSLLDKTDAWDYPVLTPTRTDFWVRADSLANAVLAATYWPRAHTFNAYTPS